MRWLIEASHLMLHPLTAILVASLLVYLYRVFRPNLAIKRRLNRALAQRLDSLPFLIPVVGKLLLRILVARVLFTLAALIEAGVPADTALGLSGKATDNTFLVAEFRKAQKALQQGDSLSGALARQNLVPAGAIQMIAVGEEVVSDLPRLLRLISSIYEEDARLAIVTFISLLEPTILFLMGCLGAFIIISAVAPMVSLLQQL